jgi:hypothetical protein
MGAVSDAEVRFIYGNTPEGRRKAEKVIKEHRRYAAEAEAELARDRAARKAGKWWVW